MRFAIDLDKWLKITADQPTYWRKVRVIADLLGSDGCSGVPEFYHDACLEHDIHYRTHRFIQSGEVDKATADYIFRRRIQQRSRLGRLSPVSWWRWWAVKRWGGKAWSRGLESV